MIPFLYRVYEINLLKSLKAKNLANPKIFEYFRGEWTFHTKGLWLYEANEETPSLTIIGSSNYSQRSYARDNEIQLYIYSKCPKLKEKLHNENERQFKQASKIEINDIRNDKEVKIKWRHHFFFWILKSFL